jgi:hypothetical protein
MEPSANRLDVTSQPAEAGPTPVTLQDAKSISVTGQQVAIHDSLVASVVAAQVEAHNSLIVVGVTGQLSGDARVLVDRRSAAAFGAGVGLVLWLLNRLGGRGRRALARAEAQSEEKST